MKKKIVAMTLCIALCLTIVLPLAACEEEASKPDALVVMTEELDGLFNPFFATTATDSTIVSMTQIGMLTTGYDNGEVTVACGDNQAVAVKDYNIVHNDFDFPCIQLLENGCAVHVFCLFQFLQVGVCQGVAAG